MPTLVENMNVSHISVIALSYISKNVSMLSTPILRLVKPTLASFVGLAKWYDF